MATAKTWFERMNGDINDVGLRLGLDEHKTEVLREFVLAKSKEEFMNGNRSGIRWARLNPTKTV